MWWVAKVRASYRHFKIATILSRLSLILRIALLKNHIKMGNPQSTGSSGGDGELICRRPHKRRQSRSCFVFIRSEHFYGSVLPEVELLTAATDMTTANTKMIPNACNTILLSSLTVS